MCHVTHASLRPLIYPLVQVMVGVVSLQPSARYYPLRLHVVRTLLQLSSSTGSYIPVASYLLEVHKKQSTTYTVKLLWYTCFSRYLKATGWVWQVM